jgi:hypothetical protein
MATSPRADRRVRDVHGRQVDTRADVAVARLAERDWGVLSVGELRACGLTDREIALRVAGGRLHRKHRAVYAVGHSSVALQGRFLAAVKACGRGAVLSHLAAAVLWGLLEWDHRDVDVTVRRSGTRMHAGIRAHRTAELDRGDWTRVQGIPVTSPARTLLDCAAVLDDRSLRRAVREAQARGLVTTAELVQILGRLRPRRGSRKLARIVATGPAPTRSVLEDTVLDLLLRGGFAHPDVNMPLLLEGRRVVPDFRWPEQRLVVEADGAAWHDHKLAREDDAERQALLEAHGDRVVRVTWDQAVARPAQTLARLRAAGAPGAAAPTPSVEI